jgi:hypothetical protein
MNSKTLTSLITIAIIMILIVINSEDTFAEVLKPDPGDIWCKGVEYEISWQDLPLDEIPSLARINIYLFRDEPGGDKIKIDHFEAPEKDPELGIYGTKDYGNTYFRVPSNIEESDHYAIKFQVENGPVVLESDPYFTIKRCAVDLSENITTTIKKKVGFKKRRIQRVQIPRILKPSSDDIWYKGQQYQIKWQGLNLLTAEKVASLGLNTPEGTEEYAVIILKAKFTTEDSNGSIQTQGWGHKVVGSVKPGDGNTKLFTVRDDIVGEYNPNEKIINIDAYIEIEVYLFGCDSFWGECSPNLRRTIKGDNFKIDPPGPPQFSKAMMVDLKKESMLKKPPRIYYPMHGQVFTGPIRITPRVRGDGNVRYILKKKVKTRWVRHKTVATHRLIITEPGHYCLTAITAGQTESVDKCVPFEVKARRTRQKLIKVPGTAPPPDSNPQSGKFSGDIKKTVPPRKLRRHVD